MDAVKALLLTYFIPEKCYDQLFVKLQLLHVPCLKIGLRKSLGIWVMLGTVAAKLPQMLKLMGAKSSDGLSFPSALADLYAAAGTLAVRLGHNFPLSAWGDSLFILIQMLAITFLILHYKGQTARGLAFLVLCGSLILVLLFCTVPMSLITALRVSSIPAVVISRLHQAWTCCRIGHTGQLSAFSVFLLFAGSQAQLISCALEMGDLMSVLSHGIICCSDSLLVVQMLCYWSRGLGMKRKME